MDKPDENVDLEISTLENHSDLLEVDKKSINDKNNDNIKSNQKNHHVIFTDVIEENDDILRIGIGIDFEKLFSNNTELFHVD
jgi:hypothetical protein